MTFMKVTFKLSDKKNGVKGTMGRGGREISFKEKGERDKKREKKIKKNSKRSMCIYTKMNYIDMRNN